jgi:hypothetical protein
VKNKNKVGTPIFRESNLGCRFCYPRSQSDGFSVCANPLCNVENKPKGRWIVRCPENSMECRYIKDKEHYLEYDFKLIIGAISKKDPDKLGWVYFTDFEFESIVSCISSSVDDIGVFITWIFNYYDYVLLGKGEMVQIDDEIKMVYCKV